MQQCKSDPMAYLVAKFHKDVSEGPSFIICTCCSQLWYKHSVCLAERTRLSNPNMIKHLQNIMLQVLTKKSGFFGRAMNI